MKFIFALLLLLAPAPVIAVPQQPHLHSAVRHPQESARSAYQRYLTRLRGAGLTRIDAGNAVNSAKPLKDLDFSRITRWDLPRTATEAFIRIRDTRFLTDPQVPGFMRRSSWLYPDDGCFARAGLMGRNLEKMGLPRPGKAFIFGNLTVKTPNSPSGSVSWWYHVVPILAVGQTVIVLDPAISPKNPLRLQDWVMTMTKDPANVTVALCSPHTYSPYDSCAQPIPDDSSAERDQMSYLSSERSRLIEMNRDPSRELGDFPPWKIGQRR